MKTLTFLIFNIGQSVQGRYGGTGVFIQSILEMLQQYSDEGRISLKTIELKHNPNLIKGAKLRNLLTDLLVFVNDFRKLIFNKSDILLWVYPKTPIIAFTGERHFLILARLGYNLLKMSKNFSGIKIATVIEETIVELRNYLGLGVKHTSLTNILERQIFALSDVLLTPSELMRTYIEQKHSFHNKTWINYQRDVYMKLNDGILQKQITSRKEKINILCSGGLMLAQENLRRIILEIKDIPTAHLYICGIGGEWIHGFISENQVNNAEYLGVLNYKEHDYLASKCDFGLIHYRPGYHDFKSTIKYCSYAANGLAILSIQLKTISEIIKEEELGEALDEEVFFNKLRFWASSKENFIKYKRNALKLSRSYQDGYHIRIWLDELLNLY